MADLARVPLDEERSERMLDDLAAILEYVELLGAVAETGGGQASAGDSNGRPLLRADLEGGTLSRADALGNAASSEDGFLIVPAFLPEEP